MIARYPCQRVTVPTRNGTPTAATSDDKQLVADQCGRVMMHWRGSSALHL